MREINVLFIQYNLPSGQRTASIVVTERTIDANDTFDL